MKNHTHVTTGTLAPQCGATSGRSALSNPPAALRGSACLLSCLAALLGLAAQPLLAAPANDNFADAIELVGNNGNQTGTGSVGATFEVDEPECLYPETTKTVWFKWVATDPGSFTISTTGSTAASTGEWDAVVCIYTGTALDSLTEVKNQDSGVDESVTLTVTPGTYYIQLGGWNDEEATNINLTWSFLMNVVDISGTLTQVLDTVVGTGNSGRLTANTQTYWAGTNSVSDVNLNDFQFSLDTGGGNAQTYNGALTGPGVIRINGRFDASWDPDVRLAGTVANTPTSVVLSAGRVTLNKTDGVDALAGAITAASGSSTKRIWLQKGNQIHDDATIDSSASSGLFELVLNGFSERIASLTLGAGHKVSTGVGGVLNVDSLIVDGVPMPKGAYTAGSHSFVTGTGYIDVDDFGPPVIENPPATPANPSPGNSAANVNPAYFQKLEWGISDGATSYDIYLWLASESKPGLPTATVITNEFNLPADLLSLTGYHWQVVAKNTIGSTDGPLWSFTTVARWELIGNQTLVLDSVIGAGNTGLLVGNAMTHWAATNSLSDVNLGGFEFHINTGGGNQQNYNGAITGPGTLRITGRYTADWNLDAWLGGESANSPTSVILSEGRVTLNKTDGVDALAGVITVAAGGSTKRIWLENNNQIHNASTIDSTASNGFFELMLNGFNETIAGLNLKAGHMVNTGTGGVLTVASLIVDGVTLTGGPYTAASNSEFVSGTGSVVVGSGGGGGFATWAAAKGLVGADAAFDADLDGDGIPNGIEFVIGGEPNPAHPDWNSSALLPAGVSDGTNFVFTYTLRNDAAYLNPVVEFDTGLDGPWSTAVDPGNATIDVAPGTPAATVTVTIPKNGNPAMYGRLKVTEP